MNTVCLFSGGLGSWAAAARLVEQGKRPTLLFTDTLIEDEDLYRFLGESSADLGLPVVYLADGRTPWQVFRDEKFLGNTRVDPCSKILKRELARKWIDAKFPDGATVAIGIDWTEINRYTQAAPRWAPHELVAPLTEPPYLSKGQMLEMASARGLTPPRLYGMGFPHNNCGGFCVKQGHAGFLNLLRKMPERYAEHEAEEQSFREYLGRDVAILRDRKGGNVRPLTLRELRETDDGAELNPGLFGGCGCGL